MKKGFYLTLEALCVLKIFKVLSWLFDHVGKQLDLKDQVNSEIYDVTIWLISNCNTHILQYRKKERQPGNEIWWVNKV